MKDTPLGKLINSLDENSILTEIQFNEFNDFLNSYYKRWFPKAKNYTDTDTTNIILKYNVKEKDAKTWVRYQLYALIKSSRRLFDNIVKFQTKNPELVRNEIILFKELLIDCSFFLQFSISHIDSDSTELIKNKDFALEPNAIFSASRLLLRNHIIEEHPGRYASRYAAVFFIRQSIEVLIKNIFGVLYITNKFGEIQKIQPEIFFDLIDDTKTDNNFPLPKCIIKNIHSWTQTFVHAGFVPYIWQIEWCQTMLEPLFDFRKVILYKPFVEKLDNIIIAKLERDILIQHVEIHNYYATIE